VGDEVWLLEGGAVPYVLRRQIGGEGERFVFLGECYVHGAMHGELLQDDWAKEQLRTLVIV
jgi:predicted sulfurtransferase